MPPTIPAILEAEIKATKEELQRFAARFIN